MRGRTKWLIALFCKRAQSWMESLIVKSLTQKQNEWMDSSDDELLPESSLSMTLGTAWLHVTDRFWDQGVVIYRLASYWLMNGLLGFLVTSLWELKDSGLLGLERNDSLTSAQSEEACTGSGECLWWPHLLMEIRNHLLPPADRL